MSPKLRNDATARTLTAPMILLSIAPPLDEHLKRQAVFRGCKCQVAKRLPSRPDPASPHQRDESACRRELFIDLCVRRRCRIRCRGVLGSENVCVHSWTLVDTPVTAVTCRIEHE